MKKQITVRSTQQSSATFGATLFERLAAVSPVQRRVVRDYYPGVHVPVAAQVVGPGGFRATFATERQATRQAFLGMASAR